MNVDLVVRTAVGEWDSVLAEPISRDVDARFAELVEQRARFVFRVAYAVLRNAQDAEDVVQETFLKLLKNKSWLQMEDERAFLARTAWRLAIDRKPKKLSAIDDFSSTTGDPEYVAMEAERTRRVHALIDALPEKLRRPLTLSAIEELSVPEIAAIMDEPEGTVRRRITEARALLKQKLERLEASRNAR